MIGAHNGDVVVIGPSAPGIIDQVPHGRLYKDGEVLIEADDEALTSRRSLAFAGIISIGIAITGKGELAGDPDVVIAGIPQQGRNGLARPWTRSSMRRFSQTLDAQLPRQKRRDADLVSGAVERAVRNAVRNHWGKKPIVHVLVMEV